MSNFNMDNIDEIISSRSVDFVRDIEGIVADTDVSYMEALVEYTEAHSLEFETVGQIVAEMPVIREKLAIEAEGLNLLPKTSRLPLW